MILLSIDVGIRNLAYIIIKIHDVDHHEILKWDVLELIDAKEKASTAQNTHIGKSLCNQFDDILPYYNIETILIENQIGQNAIKMKTKVKATIAIVRDMILVTVMEELARMY